MSKDRNKKAREADSIVDCLFLADKELKMRLVAKYVKDLVDKHPRPWKEAEEENGIWYTFHDANGQLVIRTMDGGNFYDLKVEIENFYDSVMEDEKWHGKEIEVLMDTKSLFLPGSLFALFAIPFLEILMELPRPWKITEEPFSALDAKGVPVPLVDQGDAKDLHELLEIWKGISERNQSAAENEKA